MRNEIIVLQKRLIDEKRGALATLVIGVAIYIEESHIKCDGFFSRGARYFGYERAAPNPDLVDPSKTPDISWTTLIGFTCTAAILGGLTAFVCYWGTGSWTPSPKIGELSKKLDDVQRAVARSTTRLDTIDRTPTLDATVAMHTTQIEELQEDLGSRPSKDSVTREVGKAINKATTELSTESDAALSQQRVQSDKRFKRFQKSAAATKEGSDKQKVLDRAKEFLAEANKIRGRVRDHYYDPENIFNNGEEPQKQITGPSFTREPRSVTEVTTATTAPTTSTSDGDSQQSEEKDDTKD